MRAHCEDQSQLRGEQRAESTHSKIVGDSSTVQHFARDLNSGTSSTVDHHNPPSEPSFGLRSSDLGRHVADVALVGSTSESMGDHKNGPSVDGVLSSDGRGEIEADLTSVRDREQLTAVH